MQPLLVPHPWSGLSAVYCQHRWTDNLLGRQKQLTGYAFCRFCACVETDHKIFCRRTPSIIAAAVVASATRSKLSCSAQMWRCTYAPRR
ncbi:hypothetical protein V5799_007566 [Amblyomma americanum]|uniref:Uncharacterized protein n=1 Tax=Amblyomma americanum TaxID=6943 RepID=A0AAQ4FFP5_AMBAM